MTIDLLNLLINPSIAKQICFLCFKQQEELQNIYSDTVIIDEDMEYTVSVSKMMVDLFPYQEILLQQVCDKCSIIILNIYLLVQKHNFKLQNLLKIAQKLGKEVSSVKEFNKKCYLRLTDEPCIPKLNALVSNLNVNFHDCTRCDMKLETKDQLREHTQIGHKNINEAVICHICGKTCKTSNALKSHLNCHREKQCPYCSKVLKTHSHFKIHVQNHISAVKRKHNPTSYNCHNCSFTSYNKGSLEAHINKSHLRLRPHICPICYKGFFKKSNLTEHMSIHQKVKNETCEVCGDNFVSKKTLTEHLRLHNNEMPYECSICFKKFVTSGRRSDHVKRSHMEKTECCMFCNKMFSLRKELNRHVKKAHWQSDVSGYVGNVEDCANIEVLMPTN